MSDYLKSSEQVRLLQVLFENIPLGIVTFDGRGMLMFINPYCRKTFYGKKTGDDLNHINVTNRQLVGPEIADGCTKLLATGETFSLEGVKWRTWLTNREIVLKVRGVPLHPSGGLMLVEDIIEKAQLEQQIIQEERLRVLGEMAEGLVYTFNNMMTIILSTTQLMRMKLYNPESVEHTTKVISKTVRQAADVVRKIQTLPKIGDTSSTFRPVNLNDIVEEAITVGMRPEDRSRATERNIEVRTELGDTIMVNGNVSGLLEVVTHLIFNAIDAMPDGGTLTVTTRRVRDLEDEGTRGEGAGERRSGGAGERGSGGIVSGSPRLPVSLSGGRWGGDWVELVVADTGLGMTEEIRQRCFEPFFTTKKAKLGGGLGLSTVNRIMMQHGGGITVESTPGKGTAFTIKLPAVFHIQEEPPATLLSVEEDRRVKRSVEEGRRAKLLVIDDEKNILNMLSQILQDCSVDTASTSAEGLKLFRKTRHEVVITDLGMPKISGIDVAITVKALRPSTSVILITGWEIEERSDILNSKDIDFYIPKPFELTQLQKVVKQAIELSDQRAKFDRT